ncbi:MAG: aldehyde dehydrogenase family protein [Chloroflexi bacterium]|jgi:glyceraldehyde-3-phosphate dehydrogenase (NADP+)|nr:MAG: aldehyde dehydrogenase family protein [Chloroflexota bacterium]
MEPQKILIAGSWETSPTLHEVRSPFDGRVVGTTYLASPDQVERAAAGSIAGFAAMRALGAWERSAILRTTATAITARREELAALLSAEAGKPLRDALAEIDRGALTFRLAGEEAERMIGETIPLDLNAAGKDRLGITRRFPIGPVLGISPFNFPLNLAAHKVAPAIAAGCSIVLKPPSADPLIMLKVAEIMVEAGLPKGALSVIPTARAEADRLIDDERFRLLSFTGSPAIGWKMKARAGTKRVLLELGGNAACIIDASAQLDWAVKRTLVGSFAYAGQVCISVQRIFVHASIADEFERRLVAGAATLKVGDPADAATDVGPLIDDGAAARTSEWIAEAVAGGARLLAGGAALDPKSPRLFAPTILADVPRTARICSEEAFAPVVLLERFSDFNEALTAVNASRYGLQCGLFSNDLAHVRRAFDELEVGGVIVNDVPTYRIDNMPYGGVKESGLGREGVRWAVEEMTELRLLVLADPQ